MQDSHAHHAPCASSPARSAQPPRGSSSGCARPAASRSRMRRRHVLPSHTLPLTPVVDAHALFTYRPLSAQSWATRMPTAALPRWSPACLRCDTKPRHQLHAACSRMLSTLHPYPTARAHGSGAALAANPALSALRPPTQPLPRSPLALFAPARQLLKGNTFAGTAFFSYGAFWISWCAQHPCAEVL